MRGAVGAGFDQSSEPIGRDSSQGIAKVRSPRGWCIVQIYDNTPRTPSLPESGPLRLAGFAGAWVSRYRPSRRRPDLFSLSPVAGRLLKLIEDVDRLKGGHVRNIQRPNLFDQGLSGVDERHMPGLGPPVLLAANLPPPAAALTCPVTLGGGK